jgi:hypothetical protein
VALTVHGNHLLQRGIITDFAAKFQRKDRSVAGARRRPSLDETQPKASRRGRVERGVRDVDIVDADEIADDQGVDAFTTPFPA